MQILHEAGVLSIKDVRARCLAAIDGQAWREACTVLPLQCRDPGDA